MTQATTVENAVDDSPDRLFDFISGDAIEENCKATCASNTYGTANIYITAFQLLLASGVLMAEPLAVNRTVAPELSKKKCVVLKPASYPPRSGSVFMLTTDLLVHCLRLQ